MTPWIELVACGCIVWWAGTRLSRYGDILAEKTGLGRTWIGVVLLATVTSLPELSSGLSAVLLAGAPDLAVGNILGACVLNLSMIVVLDFLYQESSVYTRASQGHILSAGFGVILIGLVAVNLILGLHDTSPAVLGVGLSSFVIVATYAIGARTIFNYERNRIAEHAEEHAEQYPTITLSRAAAGYALAAAFVVTAGSALPGVGDRLASAMGWHHTFVGTILLAFVTTLPEMAVTVSAFRLGAVDLAIGNLFGSNLFNIAILALEDVAYRPGPILAHASFMHVVSAVSAMVMSGVAIVGLFYRPQTRVFRTIGWTSLFLLTLYLLNTYVLFLLG